MLDGGDPQLHHRPGQRRLRLRRSQEAGLRIANAVQAHAKARRMQSELDEALRRTAKIATAVLAGVQADLSLAAMGVECLNLFLTTVKPTPETAKALEAEYREGRQQRADQAKRGGPEQQ